MIPDIIFLATGQSNEAGRAPISTMPPWQFGDRIFMMNKRREWVTAIHPTHFRKGDLGGPSIYTAEVIAEAFPLNTVGIIPCAVTGTDIKFWVEGGKWFENSMKMAAGVDVSGVVFYQGEEDSKSAKLRAAWPDQLVRSVEAFRRRLNKPQLPFVFTQLCHSVKNEANFDLMRVVQANAAPLISQPSEMIDARVPGAALVDNNHIDGPTSRAVGRLHGEALVRLMLMLP